MCLSRFTTLLGVNLICFKKETFSSQGCKTLNCISDLLKLYRCSHDVTVHSWETIDIQKCYPRKFIILTNQQRWSTLRITKVVVSTDIEKKKKLRTWVNHVWKYVYRIQSTLKWICLWLFFSFLLPCIGIEENHIFYGHVAADGYINVHLAFHSWERSMNNSHDAPTTSTTLFFPMKLRFWRFRGDSSFSIHCILNCVMYFCTKNMVWLVVNMKYLSLQVVFPKWKVVMTQTKGFWFIFYGLSTLCNLFNP